MAPIKQFSISHQRIFRTLSVLLTRNVLQVSSVLEPWATSGNVICRALALGLDEHRGIHYILAIPRGERLEKLKTVRRGADCNLDRCSVCWWSLESVFSWIVSLCWELVTFWLGEFEFFAV